MASMVVFSGQIGERSLSVRWNKAEPWTLAISDPAEAEAAPRRYPSKEKAISAAGRLLRKWRKEANLS